MSNPAGTRFETRLVNYLVERGFKNVERRARNGKNDRGDIAGLEGVCIEAKAVKRLALAEWVDEMKVETANAKAEIGAVVFPRKNHAIGRAYVVFELDQFIAMIGDGVLNGTEDRRKEL